ncbi:radical SAM protein [Halobacteriaceae archaeon GCM10025711]
MHLTFDVEDGWTDRTYHLEDEEGTVIEEIGTAPTLDTLREAERRHGERLDLWQTGLICSECDSPINGRFSADLDGNPVCWECAMAAQQDDQNGLRVNADPTKAVISESSLHEKSLADYVVNVATGCRHGCKFCYVPSTPAIQNREAMLNEQAGVEDSQQEWGSYLLYRDDLPERIHRELEAFDPDNWKTTDRGRGAVMLSSGTDCYQDRRAAQITRGVVQELVAHGIPVRVLTRSPAVVRDIDLFTEANGLVTVGSSIPSFDTALVRAMEPNAPPPMKRWEALDRLQKAGVPVFVSMSPTYPTMDEDDLWELLTWFRALDPEVIFHEPVNPRGANFQMMRAAMEDVGYQDVADELARVNEDEDYWVEYALEQIHLVRELADQIGGLNIHSWPDRKLVEATSGSTKHELLEMKREISPEGFASSENESHFLNHIEHSGSEFPDAQLTQESSP